MSATLPADAIDLRATLLEASDELRRIADGIPTEYAPPHAVRAEAMKAGLKISLLFNRIIDALSGPARSTRIPAFEPGTSETSALAPSRGGSV